MSFFSPLNDATGHGSEGAPEGRSRNVLAIVGLLVIIAGAVVLSLWQFFSPTPETRPRNFQKLHFRCSECSREFEIPKPEYSAWASANKPAKLGWANCPYCKAKLSGEMMNKCQSCGKYFTSTQARRAGGGRSQAKCPHCGVEIGTFSQAAEDGRPREPAPRGE